MTKRLTKIEAHYDPNIDCYPYLHLQYEIEDEYVKKIVDIPKAVLYLPTDNVTLDEEVVGNYTCNYGYGTNFYDCVESHLKLGTNYLRLVEGKSELAEVQCKYVEKILERKTKKMTVEEIEKVLGYSVEIVSEK